MGNLQQEHSEADVRGKKNTRIVQNPGDVLVVGSKGFWERILILFTYYNTQDSEWMNQQANKPTSTEHVTMCKQNLSNPALVEK